jgi:hypothetical protein
VILPADELFESSKSQLLPDGRKRMVALARALTTVPARRLSVIAYTDTTPPDEGTTNAALSSARALTIREVLARGKIAVAAMGRGEREPIASNDYEEGRRQNRRIEVLVHVDCPHAAVRFHRVNPGAPSLNRRAAARDSASDPGCWKVRMGIVAGALLDPADDGAQVPTAASIQVFSAPKRFIASPASLLAVRRVRCPTAQGLKCQIPERRAPPFAREQRIRSWHMYSFDFAMSSRPSNMSTLHCTIRS